MKLVRCLKQVGLAVVYCASLSSAIYANDHETSRWQFNIRSDQQESVGYEANVGYRLPTMKIPGLAVLSLPGLFVDAGVGERLFQAAGGDVSGVRAQAWNVGLSVKPAVSNNMYLAHKTSVVQVQLPQQASQKRLRYLESSFGAGFGGKEGTFVEVGANLRFMDKLEKPVTVGGSVIQDKTLLYPSMTVGYLL